MPESQRLVYLHFLERARHRFVAAVAAIGDAPDGVVVVHCHGGKDRTGIVVALLLRLAGVPIDEIAADYALSGERLDPGTSVGSPPPRAKRSGCGSSASLPRRRRVDAGASSRRSTSSTAGSSATSSTAVSRPDVLEAAAVGCDERRSRSLRRHRDLRADSLGQERRRREAGAARSRPCSISADSAQLYRGLPILTNQSPAALVGIWDLDHEASVAEYQALAHGEIDAALDVARTPIVVGGTGLYFRAALAELDVPPAPEPGVRERWQRLYDEEGAEAAHARLAELDPDAAAAVHVPARGPPIDWERASGPMRGALIGAMLLRGASRRRRGRPSERLAAGRGHGWTPATSTATVGPMAGVVSPSMWMFEVRDAEHGGTAYCSLNEGLGKVLRYGAYGARGAGAAALDGRGARARAAADAASWPARSTCASLIAQALQMGDELHNRNRAATSLLLRELAPGVVEAAAGQRRRGAALHQRQRPLLPERRAWPRARSSTDAARDVPGSTMVVAMARNGTDFGIQVSGLGDRWFTGPAGVPDGLYLGAYGPADANPDIGDSTITETSGLGGFAMAAAPAIVRFVGGDVADAMAATRSMYEITLAEHPAYQIPGSASGARRSASTSRWSPGPACCPSSTPVSRAGWRAPGRSARVW